MRIEIVKSYRDVPYKGIDSYTMGYSDPKTGDIYLIEGKYTPAVKEHEIFHSMKRHPDRPHDPKDFVEHEIEAYVYAYGRISRPRHILGVLRGIYNDLVRDKYNLGGEEALGLIKEVILDLDTPIGWQKDYRKLSKQVRKSWLGANK